MIGRLIILSLGLLIGLVLARGLPEPSGWLPGTAASSATPASEPKSAARAGRDDQPGIARLSPDAIGAAGIDVAPVESGTIAHGILVPGTIVPQADRIAHVSVKLAGIVSELRKNIGDRVERNEVVAVLDSREIAEAKSEYLAASQASTLQQDLFEADKALWDRGASSKKQLLSSRNDAARAKMRGDVARQKLFALGLTQAEIEALPGEPEALLRHLELRSPISGQVAERKADLGMVVGRDDLETELFTIADLDRVWVDLAVSPEDVPQVRIGQTVRVAARGIAEAAEGRLIFIGPMLDKDSRSARVVAEIDNPRTTWRPGSFVRATIVVERRPAPLAVPVGAIQTMDGVPVAFVRTSDGFQKRQVVLGQADEREMEVVSGLRAGEPIAVSNTFLLKAEMLKGAEDE